MSEREIDVRADVTLRVHTFGGSTDPAIVLVAGGGVATDMTISMDAWDTAFCERLAAGLRYVIRYHGREAVTYDSAISDSAASDGPTSGGGERSVATDDDLVGDVTGVLDALKVARAHLVARAGGVHVAQLVAKRAPDRVASLILVATDRFNTQPTANPGGETSAPTFVLSGTEDGLVTAILRHTSGGWQHQADRLANRSVADNPTGWFNELYTAATAGEVDMPWDRDEPNPVLSGWAHEHPVTGDRRTALIVGSGLGRDAEFIASLGFDTTAFDVSPAAIANSHTRYPESPVDYRVANLLDPPTEWTRAFDLVVEIFTVQAMPRTVRTLATANIGQFVAPGGTLVVIQAYAVPVDEHGPPWILSRAEIDAFAADGLRAAHVDVVDSPSGRRWLAEFGRTA